MQLSSAAARLARSLGMTVIFNASPVPADIATIPAEMWPAVDVLLVNGTEAALLSGIAVTEMPEAARASAELRRRFGIATVVVTLGGRGVVMVDESGSHHLPAWPVEVVETIGAGDAFAGVLASELARGLSLQAALPLANAAGALAATRPGAHDSLPTGAEIRAFLRDRQHADV
jgi:ribokinase